ncbi:MAG: radical SAM protein [Victivallaceae bacterium]|nr:radical SAM protein [Victivallaceae bacterium]
MNHKYIFGPVASRRLGVSLGVDLVPSKTCPLDCIYCEAGKTTNLTMERREYIPVTEIIRQLDETLKNKPELDYITFSGGGEPTLNSGLGCVVNFVKDSYPKYRICLLTNGCLLWDEQVVKEIARVDLVIPSLDATTEEEFNAVNRHSPDLTLEKMLSGMFQYAKVRTSELWLEIFIAPGLNDSDASIARFADITAQIKPDKVQLNTLDRPGVVDWLKASEAANTMRFIRVLEKIAPVEAVGPFRYYSRRNQKTAVTEAETKILGLISRRPATIPDLQIALGMEAQELKNILEQMLKSGQINFERLPRGDFYSIQS